MDEGDEGTGDDVKQEMLRAVETVATPESVDLPPPVTHEVHIVDGALIVKRLDGTPVVTVPKGQWSYNKITTCVRCSGNAKPPGIPDFIPCC